MTSHADGRAEARLTLRALDRGTQTLPINDHFELMLASEVEPRLPHAPMRQSLCVEERLLVFAERVRRGEAVFYPAAYGGEAPPLELTDDYEDDPEADAFGIVRGRRVRP